MLARPLLAPLLLWVIGNGQTCALYAQPWVPGWQQFKPINQIQRRAKVIELFDEQSGHLDPQKLTSLPKPLAVAVAQTHHQSRLHPSVPDRLMFTPAQNGTFTTKQAYLQLIASHTSPNAAIPVQTDTWRLLWKSPN